MALDQQTLSGLSKLLPLDNDSLTQIITYTKTLPDAEAAEHLRNLLGDSPQALEFITSFNTHLSNPRASQMNGSKSVEKMNVHSNGTDASAKDEGGFDHAAEYAPPPYPPPSASASKTSTDHNTVSGGHDCSNGQTPSFAPPTYPPPTASASQALQRPHTNQVTQAANIRAKDEVNFSFSIFMSLFQISFSVSKVLCFCQSLTPHSKKCKIGFQLSNSSTKSTTPRSSPSMTSTATVVVQSTSITA